MADTTVLITVTGPDRPGVSSVLFAALTRHGVDLLDVEQVVIRGRLTLGALVSAQHDPEGLQEAVEQAMASISMQVETSLEAHDDPASRRRSSHVVVVIGRPITARAFGSVAQALAEAGANIDSIRRVSSAIEPPGISTRNSSPPRRKIGSVTRKWTRSARAITRMATSPASWPNSSFIFLRSFMSTEATVPA